MKKILLICVALLLVVVSFANQKDVERNQKIWNRIFTQFKETTESILTQEEKQEVIANVNEFLKAPQKVSLLEPSVWLLACYLLEAGALEVMTWPDKEELYDKYAFAMEGLVPAGQEKLALHKINAVLPPPDKGGPTCSVNCARSREDFYKSLNFEKVLRLMRNSFEKARMKDSQQGIKKRFLRGLKF